MRKKDLYTLIGFILFATGLTSIILNVVGVEWFLLQWMSGIPSLLGFMIKLIMIVGGLVIIYLNKINWRE
ncbi:MAG: hypothetical protein IPF67_04605 [Saprospiraceae bacterium]|nr:hypothetical protein [Candidatus Brachybacter algidus]